MAFKYQKDEQNIVIITMDMPGRSANVINQPFYEAMQKTLAQLVEEKALAGVIITSAKKTFLVTVLAGQMAAGFMSIRKMAKNIFGRACRSISRSVIENYHKKR